MTKRCEDCGCILERYGCVNCSDSAFIAMENLKNTWASEDIYEGLISDKAMEGKE